MKNCIILTLGCLLWQFAMSQQKYWQQEADYTIDVTLNDKDHTLRAFLQLEYTNNSPDTLSYIWFHLWPNAYKNDRTAFSDQLLEDGRTDFYFSSKEQRGYINRLDFRMDNITLKQEDHPLYIDIVKVYLLHPLAPGATAAITTPFQVKLPWNFSRGGHTGQSYQVTQWYPKPAVYDRKGWHEMPYLDQGEFYSELGSFDVKISTPPGYIVAATGELQDSENKQETGKDAQTGPANSVRTRHYHQDRVHDFAWFADKSFVVDHDTIVLASGRVIQAYSYYSSASVDIWKNSISFIKDAIRFRSAVSGEYPFNVVTAVEAKMGFDGGMEYPTITSIAYVSSEASLEEVLEHEIGHNWFYGVLASNERDHPWMDEGINSYYDTRYREWKAEMKRPAMQPVLRAPGWIIRKLPLDPAQYLISALAKEKNDQPISTSSASFTPTNYALIAYTKTALWMQQLCNELGKPLFDSAMKVYYDTWKFRHPYPEDFREIMERTSGKDLSASFALLNSAGALPPLPAHRKIRPTFLFSARNTDSISFINFSPAIGYNNYDKFMVGIQVNNFGLPANRLSFFAAPMYATNSKKISGTAGAGYSWLPAGIFKKIETGISGSAFSIMDGTDSNGNKIFGSQRKIVPFLRMTLRNPDMRDNTEKWIEWKTFFIGETGFDYSLKTEDQLYYPSLAAIKNRYLNQLSFNYTDYRVLYPYDLQLQLQQGESFYRLNATGHYFFNYTKGGGMQMRLFAAKFGYLGGRNSTKEFETYLYQPKLTAVRGNEDYTYSDYFIGRNEQEGFAGQQIMMRDGGLKLRTDLFQDLQGRSDNWVAAVNFNTTLPNQLLPVKLPLRIFLDIGTYAGGWLKDAATSRFLYVAGLQVSLFKDFLNIYAPVIFSKEFRDELKTVPEENKFFKRISFSIDVHRFNLRRVTGNKYPF